MLLQPNPSSGVPIYLQLIERVKRSIETGALRPGEPLPGIRPLAEALVINPNTVAKAYRELECEGVIDLRPDAAGLLAFARGFEKPSRGRVDRRPVHELYNDLETAREVQQRLLPQESPPIAGVDYAGVCRPVYSVGGDYYDFIRLSDTELGIAVADVCGKGIPAALLMATLRAYLHGETQHCATDPAQLMRTLNRLVCESFSTNRFASFFYAHDDSSIRALHYVNAGHNPPLIFRTRERRCDVLHLDPGGPVIGLLPNCVYAQGRVTLEPGDLVVAFTDGISEAMNTAGDEWGEERLTELVEANRALPVHALIDRIMRGADEFVAGASQHDDMTLATMRVT